MLSFLLFFPNLCLKVTDYERILSFVQLHSCFWLIKFVNVTAPSLCDCCGLIDLFIVYVFINLFIYYLFVYLYIYLYINYLFVYFLIHQLLLLFLTSSSLSFKHRCSVAALLVYTSGLAVLGYFYCCCSSLLLFIRLIQCKILFRSFKRDSFDFLPAKMSLDSSRYP